MSTTAQEELYQLDVSLYLETINQDAPPVFDLPNPDLHELNAKSEANARSETNSIDYGRFFNFEDETLWLPEPERKPKNKPRAAPTDVDMEMLEAEASSEPNADPSGEPPQGNYSMTPLLNSNSTPEGMVSRWLMDLDMQTEEMPAGETEAGAAR
ncbi:hypothetical protein ACJ41O_014879 [Fusarium nematophilum]